MINNLIKYVDLIIFSETWMYAVRFSKDCFSNYTSSNNFNQNKIMKFKYIQIIKSLYKLHIIRQVCIRIPHFNLV